MIDLKNKERVQSCSWTGWKKKTPKNKCIDTHAQTLAFAPSHKNAHLCMHIYHLLGGGARQSGGKIHEMSLRLSP